MWFYLLAAFGLGMFLAFWLNDWLDRAPNDADVTAVLDATEEDR